MDETLGGADHRNDEIQPDDGYESPQLQLLGTLPELTRGSTTHVTDTSGLGSLPGL